VSLRQQLHWALWVQGLGAASVLGALLLLGYTLGPVDQGIFSRTKSELEFVRTLALCGLPQALFYFVRLGRMALPKALHWVAWSVLFALVSACAYTYVVVHFSGPDFERVFFTAAVGMSVLHGQLRTLMLLDRNTLWFNLITAWPQWWVLMTVAVCVWSDIRGDIWGGAWGLDHTPSWRLVFALGFAGAAGLALWRLRQTARLLPRDQGVATPVSASELGRYGLAAWLTALLSTGGALFLQCWVEHTQGPLSLGLFTMAMTLVQVPLTPLNYAAPLLLRHWMGVSHGANAQARRWSMALFGAALALAALLGLLSTVWPHLGLGAAYTGLALALAILLVGAAAEMASRLLAAQAHAAGQPGRVLRAEAARWSTLVVGMSLPLPASVWVVCALWSVAAFACALVFWVGAVKK
jgi:hypothetical protein